MSKLSKEQINKIISDAYTYFQANHPELTCSVNYDKGQFIVENNWKDTTYLNTPGVTNERATFKCIVWIFPNGKYYMNDVSIEDSKSLNPNKLNFNKSGFSGRMWHYTKEISFGKDNLTGEKGVIVNEYSTESVHKPIKEYFNALGLKSIFFSYKFSLLAFPPIYQYLTVFALLLGGLLTLLTGILVMNMAPIIFELVTMGSAIFLIGFGILNLYYILSNK